MFNVSKKKVPTALKLVFTTLEFVDIHTNFMFAFENLMKNHQKKGNEFKSQRNNMLG